MEKNSLSMPVAIVIAGVIIAGAIFFSNKQAAAPAGPGAQTAPKGDIKISAVSPSEHIIGNPDAPVVLVEYSDTECPFCKTFHGSLNTLMDTLGKEQKVAWVYRHFPLWKAEGGGQALHPRAEKEAEATECAAKLGGNDAFWKYTNAVYAATPSNNRLEPTELPKIAKETGLDVALFNACLASGEMAARVEAQYQEAKTAGAEGTPFSVLTTKKAFDPKKVTQKISELTLKYRSAPEYFTVGNDNMHISMSGAQPLELVRELIVSLQ